MKKIGLIALCVGMIANAEGLFLPTKNMRVIEVAKDTIRVDSLSRIDGLSAVVLHHYGKGLKAITATVVQDRSGAYRVVDADRTAHSALPTPKREIDIGDEVIVGYLYDHALLVAPSREIYNAIVSRYSSIKWLHPDHLALFLAKEGERIFTKKLLRKFALKRDIGVLVIVTQNALLLYDPIGAKVINRVGFTADTKEVVGFYHRLGKLSTGLFGNKRNYLYETLVGAVLHD